MKSCSDIRFPSNLTADPSGDKPFLCSNASTLESSATAAVANWVWIAVGVALAVILLVALILALRSHSGRNKTYDVQVVETRSRAGTQTRDRKRPMSDGDMSFRPRDDYFDESAPGGRYDNGEFSSFGGTNQYALPTSFGGASDASPYMTVGPADGRSAELGTVDSTHV